MSNEPRSGEVVVCPTVDARGELGLIDVEAIDKNDQ